MPDYSTAGTVLIYLNCHMCCVCWVVFIHVGEFMPGTDLLVAYSQQLVVAGSYYYHCLSDSQQQPCTKVEDTGTLLLGWSTGRDE